MIERIDSYKTDDGQNLELTFEEVEDNFNGVVVRTKGMPYLRDRRDSKLYKTPFTDVVLEKLVEIAKKNGKSSIDGIAPPLHIQNKRFDNFCHSVQFEYSNLEYLSIPGLGSDFSHDGFLAPVYFNNEVLNKYTQNPKYTIDIFSGTYGSIAQDDEWQISFGVNASKHVIMWLGDIDKLPIKEQQYLLSENIPSAFDIHSDFFDAQIENHWSEGAIENICLNLRREISDKVKILYSDSLYKLPNEIGVTIAGLQKPIFWEDRHVAPVVESLNRIFIESLNEDFLKEFLVSRDVKIAPGARGLKLLQGVIENLSNQTEARAIMSPFFVLYDYRINVCHLQSQETVMTKTKTINERLSIDASNASHEIIYDSLFEKIHDSLTKIKSLVEMEPK
ncbi:hypothetical protein [Ralstonia solanacearum]|uniref:hypothetical protein n=1 Tax=Ralstonia solanacearum TaxID=305 RepID=UPI000ADB84FA|nr:hypothetical protein [Ralstonia solanacearum]MCL9824938.1 hypothetical protein [Ralstonia solanacearum]MCL9828500.1 hypothetical protein [Ralstonia solanacearum]MCL9833281.1 hypothetical protein [Ralstonia solanacearum]